jgi:hypothetical protein
MDFIFDDDVDEVGSEVEAYCPKCKADTAHVIMSKYEDEIRRVQCNPCGDVHAYRKPRGETEEEATEPVTKKRAAKAKPTWEQVTAKAKKEPKLYMVADRYGDNELISHPKFGIGFVSEVIGLDKIEVTFQSERRVLVHNRKGMSLPPAAYAHAVDATLPLGKDRRKAAVKQAAVKSAAQRLKTAAASKEAAKSAKPIKAAPTPKGRAVAKAKPDKRPKPKAVASARPTNAKPKSRAAATARAKPTARPAKPVRAAAGKKVKKR